MIIPFFGFCKIAKKIVGVLGQIAHTTQYLISHMIGHQKSQHHPTISTNSFIIKRLYQRFKKIKNFKKQMGVSVFVCFFALPPRCVALLPLLFVFVPIRSLSFMLSPLFIFIHMPFFSHASITLIVLAHIPISNQLP